MFCSDVAAIYSGDAYLFDSEKGVEFDSSSEDSPQHQVKEKSQDEGKHSRLVEFNRIV